MTEEELKDWPRDPANGCYACSPGKPMPAGAPGRWSHVGARSIGESSDSSVDYWRCLDCGVRWSSEVPQ